MPRYMTLHEFAEILRVSYSTARRECEAGNVPGAIKFNSQWRIPETAFAEMAKGG
jgi:predicted site-specific integrase-resolvase